jgi:hypothetical protein
MIEEGTSKMKKEEDAYFMTEDANERKQTNEGDKEKENNTNS